MASSSEGRKRSTQRQNSAEDQALSQIHTEVCRGPDTQIIIRLQWVTSLCDFTFAEPIRQAKVWSKYRLRPKYVLNFGLSMYLGHPFGLDFHSAKSLHILA